MSLCLIEALAIVYMTKEMLDVADIRPDSTSFKELWWLHVGLRA